MTRAEARKQAQMAANAMGEKVFVLDGLRGARSFFAATGKDVDSNPNRTARIAETIYPRA